MAEFSKQYCELHDMGFEGDFDIMEEFYKLKPDYYIPYICEGYGFIAIGKDENEECILAMPIEGASYGAVNWKKYSEIVK
jgi:hypothetical protein